MDQPESGEVDSLEDINSKADDTTGSDAAESVSKPDDIISLLDEELSQTMEEDGDIISNPQEKVAEDEDRVSVPETETGDDSNVMEWEDVSEANKENGEKQSASNVDSEECETTSMAVVIMDEDIDTDSNALDKETNAAKSTEGQELDKDDAVNPLDNLSESHEKDKELENPLADVSETEKTDEGGPDVLEVIEMETNTEKPDDVELSTSSEMIEMETNTEKPDDVELSTSSETLKDGSSEIQLDKSVISEKNSKKGSDDLDSPKDTADNGVKDGDKTKETDEGEDVVELPVQKRPAMIVDLANDDDTAIDNQLASPQQIDNESSLPDGKVTSNEGKRIKLRSLASLVDITGGDDTPVDSVVSTSQSDIPAIGEIVEHGVIIPSDEMDGLQLRISNVTGGEDCITGLTVDEDRDSFSSIQISSVTTLIEPMSPEDPSKANDTASHKEGDNDKPGEEGKTVDSAPRPEVDGDVSCVVVSSKDDGKSPLAENSLQGPGDKDSKTADEKEPESTASTNQHGGAVSDVENSEEGGPPRQVYNILRSILTMKRSCLQCYKNTQCEFRVKKDDSGTWGFLCTSSCRSAWSNSLLPNHVLEKPRLIFEKLCGMCGLDLSNMPRDGQYSWETREFCSKDCITQHLNEVARKCHVCNKTVRPMFIGKYCVRFGSDIHQFCSNTCLEFYKTKIKVCCYCQKNLEKVNKVTSLSNKEYCSSKCMKRAQRRDLGQQNYTEQLPCTVCQTVNLNRYEFVSNQETFQLCSDPCLNVYKYANKVKAVPCCLCFRVMNAEDVAHYLYHGGHQLRVFCSDSCVNVFILSARKIVVCEICKVKKYNFDMIHRQVDEDFRDYFFCSLSCLTSRTQTYGSKSKNGVTSTSAKTGSVTSNSSSDPPVTNCNMCNAMAKAQYHMVMSDNTLRSFCRYACATKYKNTFGFQVNGIHSADSTQNSSTVSIIREKPSQKTAGSQSENKENTSQTKKKSMFDSSEEVNNVTAELLRLLTPPTMVNKMTSCRPGTLNKGVFCKPQRWTKEAQTDSSDINSTLYTCQPPPIIPVPVPVYVPSPMMMYNMPFPVPVIVPLPLPVPVFIPTTAKTSADIAKLMNKIQDEMPENPYEAEMLLMAQASRESAEAVAAEAEAATTVREESAPASNDFDSHGLSDLSDLDVSCLESVEEDIPRYPLKALEESEVFNSCLESDTVESEDEGDGQNNRKRKANFEEGGSRKRVCSSGDHDSVWDTKDGEAQLTAPEFTTEALGEEYPGPFLNKMYGLAAWKRWVTTKNAELAGVSSSRNMKLISDDLLAMNCEELNYALCLFLKDLRKLNGELFQPDTVFYLLLGIQQHLFDSGRTDCIFMDFGFEKFTNSFDEITKTFVCQPVSPSSVEVGVTRITEAMLWDCRQLGAHTPQVLLNTLFYFNTKVFKLKTVEDHQALSFAQIVKQWRRTTIGSSPTVIRASLLKYFTQKKGDDQKRLVLEMHENRDDPLRCPVKLYEFYLSKCPESIRNQQGIYYVYPERSCVPDSPTWFSSQTVQPGSMSKMLHRALMVKEVQEALIE